MKWQPLTVQDAVPIGLLESSIQLTPWSIQQVRETLEHGACGWSICAPSGDVMAYILLQQTVDTADILTVGVHANYQRQGWGRKAIEMAQGWAVEACVQTLFLEVRVSNHAAVALYTACGFQTLHCRKQYYSVPNQTGMREDAWIMVWQNSIIGRN